MPEFFVDIVLVGGELHRQFHSNDCLYRLWWDHVLEPAAIILYRRDIRQPFKADRFNNKERFVRLVTVAILTWIQSVDGIPESTMKDPWELLDAVSKNVPVWEVNQCWPDHNPISIYSSLMIM